MPCTVFPYDTGSQAEPPPPLQKKTNENVGRWVRHAQVEIPLHNVTRGPTDGHTMLRPLSLEGGDNGLSLEGSTCADLAPGFPAFSTPLPRLDKRTKVYYHLYV
jgi:hypothetical protein